MASRGARHAALTAYVLHHYDWSESSLILDLFTREQGRLDAPAEDLARALDRGPPLVAASRIADTIGWK